MIGRILQTERRAGGWVLPGVRSSLSKDPNKVSPCLDNKK